jgi:hypothetical protein
MSWRYRAAAQLQPSSGLGGYNHMNKFISNSITLAFLLVFLPTTVHAQDKPQLQQDIERTLKANEPDWLCKKNTPEGEPGPDSPRVFYTFDCRYKGQQTNQVFGSIYVLNSKQDAEKMLDRSQMTLQVNESKPQYGIGEQAYGYTGHASAWITFRNGNIFGQVNVGLVDPRTVANPSPEMDALTSKAFDIARRFSLYLAQYAPAK